MMRKAAVLTALFVVSVTPVCAQQWKELGTHDGSTRYSYNPKTFSVSGDRVVSSWTRRECDLGAEAAKSQAAAGSLPKGARSVLAFEEFDCRKHLKRTLAGVVEESGRKSDVDKTGWQEVRQGSLDAALLSALCREAQPEK